MLADAAAARADPTARSSRSAASAGESRSSWPRTRPTASRSSPSIRTPATTAAPRRSTGFAAEAATDRVVFEKQPRRRRRAPSGASRAGVLRPAPTAPSTDRSTCCTSTAPTATARPVPTSVTGGPGCADGGDAADPRLVLVGRRDAGDRPRARVRGPVPLRRPVPFARPVPRRPRSDGRPVTGPATRPARSRSCRGSPATSPSRSCSACGLGRLLRAARTDRSRVAVLTAPCWSGGDATRCDRRCSRGWGRTAPSSEWLVRRCRAPTGEALPRSRGQLPATGRDRPRARPELRRQLPRTAAASPSLRLDDGAGEPAIVLDDGDGHRHVRPQASASTNCCG